MSLVFELFTIFVLVVLLLLEGPKMRHALLGLMMPERAARYSQVAREVNRSVTGFMLGDFATSAIAGVVVLITLMALGVPFPFLWALWVALVDFLPMIGGALAGIPVVLFALTHSVEAGIVTLVIFLIYTQVENHILNPVIMSRTVRINPLLVLVSILVGAVARQLDRRLLRRVRGRAAGHPGGRRDAGDRSRDLARDRPSPPVAAGAAGGIGRAGRESVPVAAEPMTD